MSKEEDAEIAIRIARLLGKEKKPLEDEKELAEGCNKVLSTQAIASQNDYKVPAHLDEQDIEQEIEKMLYESDEEEDAIDDYIYDMLNESTPTEARQGPVQHKMKQLESILTGSSLDMDESDALIQRVIEENRLDEKYEQFTAKRDEDFEKRVKDLQNHSFPQDSTFTMSDKPKGSVPKALQPKDLYDETEDWCCVCNEDATIECDGCEDDNKFCKECFFQTHRSEFADYEATKHKKIIRQLLKKLAEFEKCGYPFS
ncbi:hypothetical protein G6F36_010302 [Rhizopus arrhizus]|nr:hypothetical protein G6F36_010302 [Rhizopus arrhizus]